MNNMKKLLTVFLVIIFAVSLGGCVREDQVVSESILMDDSEVQKEVNGWMVYTNPQLRYELRIPKRWKYYPEELSVKEVAFYPDDKILSDDYKGSVIIKGYVNWQNNYTLEEYYEKESSYNLMNSNLEKEEIEFKGFQAYWIKNNTSLYPGQSVDFIVFNLGDRIIEFQIVDDWQTAKTIFNSMFFYGAKAITVE